MTKSVFTQKDYEELLKCIRAYHETNSITASVDATRLIIKGILTGKLTLQYHK